MGNKRKPVPDKIEDERTPSPDQLRTLRTFLVRFRHEAADEGLWPGAATMPEMAGRSRAVGALVALDEVLRRVFPRYGDMTGEGWSWYWWAELRHTAKVLHHAVRHLRDSWPVYRPVDGELEQHLTEYVTTDIAARVTGAELPPVPEGVAGVLARCVERLDEVLANGVADAAERALFTDLQKAILEALDGTALTQSKLEDVTKVDRGQLQRENGLKGLMKRGLVKNQRAGRVGYYRPDAPPPDRLIRPRTDGDS
jgi:hypothetical protein